MDEPIISGDDQYRIEMVVAEFRHRMEFLYRMGYLQGAIDSETKARDELRRKVAA